MNFESRTSDSPVVEDIQVSNKLFHHPVVSSFDGAVGSNNNNNPEMPSNHGNFVGFMANGFQCMPHPNHAVMASHPPPGSVNVSSQRNTHFQSCQVDPWSAAQPMEKSSCQFSFTYSHHHHHPSQAGSNMFSNSARLSGEHSSLLRAKLSGNFPEKPSEVNPATPCHLQRLPMLSMCGERGE